MAVASALIGAGAAIAGGIIASKASKHATDSQLHASDEALDYQKQKDASGRAAYDKSVAEYKQQYADWVSQFYGGGGGSKAPLTSTTVAPNPAAGAPMSGAAPANLGVGAMTTVGQAGNNTTDPNGWQDWARYMPKPGLGA